MVDELILHPVMQWDTALIDRLFLQYDAKAIKNIPLNDRVLSGLVYWPGNRNGQYSVWSGYQFLVHEEYSLQLGCSTPDTLPPIWARIWSMHIPMKCQLFAWRASWEALPTKLNLQKRKIPFEPTCESCHSSVEYMLHSLWSCPHVQKVWDSKSWLLLLRDNPYTEFAD